MKNFSSIRIIGLAALGGIVAVGYVALAARPLATKTARAAAPATFPFDFNETPIAPSVVVSQGVVAKATVEAVGTVDSYGGVPTPALSLVANFTQARGKARASLCVGPAQIVGTETDLAKRTLGFDLAMNRIRPVRVVVQSLDGTGRPTGARYSVVSPPVRDAYYRFGIDLDKTKPLSGKFDPKARTIQCFFEIDDADAPIDHVADLRLRVDNLSLNAASYYVSANGSDAANGRTEKTAFATIQKAVDAAGAGDTILIMDGTYRNATPSGIATLRKAGTPARWIIIRAYPGQKPQLVNNGWEVFKIMPGAAYIELRDLTVRGNRSHVQLADALADGVLKTKDGTKYAGDPLFNGNGISVEGRSAEPQNRPHHLRFVGNHIYDNCGVGLAAIASDYVTAENNTIHDNVHYMRYGGSGISFLKLFNFSPETNHHNFIIGNHVYNNRCYVPWAAVGKMSDGNGIIIDMNIDKDHPELSYTGRTLIANNVVHGSGGGGIAVTTSQGVDIVHNTVYRNVQTPELAKANWGDIFVSGPLPGCRDVLVLNNIVVSDPGHARIHISRTTGATARNNLFFGDGVGKDITTGVILENNQNADPQFVRPSLDPQVADFRLLLGSPAIGKALLNPDVVPRQDIRGTPRPRRDTSTIGAYEFDLKK